MRQNMQRWARRLVKCTKTNRGRPRLTFRWLGVASPAEPGLVVRGRSRGSLQEGDATQQTRRLGGGKPGSPALPLSFSELLGFRCKPGFNSRPWALGSDTPCLLGYVLVDFTPCACVLAAPSAVGKEVGNLMRYSALKRFLRCIQVLTFMKTHL